MTRAAPPRALPWAYFAFSHLSLLLALFITGLWPDEIQGFFLSPRPLAVVHLLTLGWLTCTIVGATYVVAPIALGTELRARWYDWLAFLALTFSAWGVAAHFWMEEYSGVAWSGLLVIACTIGLGGKIVAALRRARCPGALKLHVGLAYFNLGLAATAGMLLAINKYAPFLTGRHLQIVFGHAHLGLVGWGVMMVVGVGYRLLPMYLPAAPPKGWPTWTTAILFEVGTIGLLAGFWFDLPIKHAAALCLAAGIGLFLFQVVAMLRHPRPPPKKMPRPDLGRLHTLQALLYLLLATGLGLFLTFDPDWHIEWTMVYGVLALLGFFAQLIIGITARLFPMFSWLEAWVGSDYKKLPTSPHAMGMRALLWITLLTWTIGVPVLAWGLLKSETRVVSTGAWILFTGATATALNGILVARHSWQRPRAS